MTTKKQSQFLCEQFGFILWQYSLYYMYFKRIVNIILFIISLTAIINNEINYLLFKKVNALPRYRSIYSKRAGDLDSWWTLFQNQIMIPTIKGKNTVFKESHTFVKPPVWFIACTNNKQQSLLYYITQNTEIKLFIKV